MEQMRNLILMAGLFTLFVGIVVALIIMSVIRHRTEIDIYHATHDHLTKLPNRALLQDRLEHLLSYSERNNKQIALMFIDVDRFKKINDTYGHEVGDLALLAVRDKIQNQLRESDTLARFSGDEFVVLLGDVKDINNAGKSADRILSEFQQLIHLGEKKVEIGVSIGIALYPEHGDVPDALIRNADMAMYESKNKGRNCWSLYHAT